VERLPELARTTLQTVVDRRKPPKYNLDKLILVAYRKREGQNC
jgi:hypothetical protein